MKKWLYFLLDDQGRSYKSTNGNVTKTAQPTPLPNTPDAWQEVSLGWERNLNRFGITRTFSLPLGFVKAANHILRTVTLTGTVESKLFLLIKKFAVETTVSTYRFIYRFFYKGELDLSTAELDEEKSTVSIMEGGLSKLLAANESNTYEFPLDDPDAVEAYCDGYTLRTTLNYRAIPTDMSSVGSGPIVFPVAFISQEGFTDVTMLKSDTFFDYLALPNLVPDESVFLFHKKNPGLFVYRVKGDFRINVIGTSVTLKYWFQSHNRGLDINTQSVSIVDTTVYANGEHIIPFDFTITVPSPLSAPESLYIALSYGGDDFEILASDFDISFLFRKSPTLVKGFKPSTLYRKLVGKVCEGEQYAESDLLAANDNFIITCGDALRGIDAAVIKTSLKQFFDSFNAWLNIGIGIENKKLKLEEKEYFFDATITPFHLGKAKELKVAFASDLFFNLLKAGYNEQEYEQAYGKFEFNNTSQFTSPITKITKEFNLIAPYRADPTGIELARINLEGKLTTDDNSDNDVFVLNCDLTTPNVDDSFNLKRVTYDTMLGIPDESQASIFNIEQLTPKRIIRQHGNWLRSILYGFEAQRLKFQTTQKNRDLRTVLGSELIDEDVDELIGNLTTPLFKPYYFEFNCESPIGVTEQLDINPNVPFSFEWDGVTYTGFLIKAGITPDNNKEQTFKLLSTPLNDITQLI